MYREDHQDSNPKIQLATWKTIIKIVFKSKKRMALLILFVSLLAVIDNAFPVFNRYAIDHFFVDKDFSTVPQFIFAYCILILAFGFIVWGFIREAGIVEAETGYELRNQAFKNIQTLSFSYFDQTPQGWVMARMTSDTRKLSEIISWGIVDLIWAFLSLITVMVVLYSTFPPLALILTCILPVMFLVAWVFRKLILKHHREAKKQNSQLTAQYSEGFLGAKTTKSLSIEDYNIDEFKSTAHKLRRSAVRAVIFSAVFSSIILFLSYLAVSITMYQGAIYVIDLTISVGTLAMFISYTVNLFDPVMVLSRIISDFQNAQASAERIVGLINTKSDLVDRDEVVETYGTLFNDKVENWEELEGSVEFKDVTYYYVEDEVVLNNFNLKVNKGMSVALVGHTGSGKTTIINLLARFYEPKEGTILIDGKDYKDRSIHWLHKRIGYVIQSPHLFSTTIMENIRYGRLEASDEEVIMAAKMVGVDRFVDTLEKKYETFVGEGGNQLSVGQKQLISFARAVLADPKILLLDEATSSIDSESEAIIQKATQELLSDRTSFIVAHRLSTIVNADLIVMLESGQIIEMGNHQELLSKKGAYFDLYRNQFFKEKGKVLEDNII